MLPKDTEIYEYKFYVNNWIRSSCFTPPQTVGEVKYCDGIITVIVFHFPHSLRRSKIEWPPCNRHSILHPPPLHRARGNSTCNSPNHVTTSPKEILRQNYSHYHIRETAHLLIFQTRIASFTWQITTDNLLISIQINRKMVKKITEKMQSHDQSKRDRLVGSKNHSNGLPRH